MKTKLLKNILCMLLISSMVLTLFSCDSSKSTDTEKSSETESITDNEKTTNKVIYETNNYEAEYDKVKDYKIIQDEKGCRLIFDNPKAYEREDNLPFIIGKYFESVKDFQDSFINGTLRYDDKRMAFHCGYKDDVGMRIPDIYNLFMPVLPSSYPNVKMEKVPVLWNCRDIYKYSIEFTEFSDNDAYLDDDFVKREDPALNPDNTSESIYDEISIFFYTPDKFEVELAQKKTVRDNVSGQKWKHEDGMSSIVYRLPGSKSTREKVVYTLSNENKIMYIIQDYYLDSNGNRLTPDIDVFCKSNGAYFYIYIGSYTRDIEEILDPQWFFEFDVEKYVPENG